MIRHHPDDSLLLAYAGGAADEALSLVVATHMAYCESCRAKSASFEAIGGSLLQDLAPAPMSGSALEATMARLDATGSFERRAASASRDGTPDVLRRYLGGDLAQVRWRRVNGNFSYRPRLRRGGVTMRLLRGVAGAQTGAHRHQGAEYTLVLKGGFSDVTGRYGPGDLQMMEGEMRHNPVADPGADCINLAVTTGALKFEDPIHKIVAPLFGF